MILVVLRLTCSMARGNCDRMPRAADRQRGPEALAAARRHLVSPICCGCGVGMQVLLWTIGVRAGRIVGTVRDTGAVIAADVARAMVASLLLAANVTRRKARRDEGMLPRRIRVMSLAGRRNCLAVHGRRMLEPPLLTRPW